MAARQDLQVYTRQFSARRNNVSGCYTVAEHHMLVTVNY